MQRLDSTRLNRLLTEEEIALRSLKLPVPKPTAHPLHHSRSDLPYSFVIPPHAAFSVSTPSMSSPQATYVILGDPQMLNNIECECSEFGLSVVAFKYPGLWLNRNPYEVYKRIQEQGIDSITPEAMPPLCLIPGFSPSQLQRFEWQANLWAAATGDISTHAPLLAGLPPLSQPDLSLPPQVSTGNLLTLKLLPVQSNRIVGAEAFLDQIRMASRPLIFELVCESRTAHFQLSFDNQDRTLIEGQLKSHFPKFFTEPLQAPHVFLTPVKPYYAVQAWLPTASDAIKPLADFSISPYSKLFAFLRDAAPDTQIALQVSFAPIASSTLQTIHTTLERYQRQLASYSDRLASEHEDFAASFHDYRPEHYQDPAAYRAKIDDLKGQAR